MTFKLFFRFVMLFVSIQIFAQGNYNMFFEPEVNLEYQVSAIYNHDFSIENRNFIYQNNGFLLNVKHLEFAHVSTFLLGQNQSIAIGVQYRFEKNFRNEQENEFRTLQGFGWQATKADFKIDQEIRFEQRFYASTTKYRWRYEIGFQRPTNAFGGTNYIKTGTETLFELAKTQKPELEQRLSAATGWQISPTTNFEFGLQYRLADYTQNLGHELFLLSALDIKL